MKTNNVVVLMLGAALLSGSAFAQADGSQTPGGGESPELRTGCRCGGGAMGLRGNRAGGGEAELMQARGGAGRSCPRGPAQLPPPQALKEAGATDQQIELLKKLEDERQLKQVDLKAAVEKAELSLEQLMRDEKADEATALKAVDALTQARAEIFKGEISSQLKIRAILGADVMKKLHEMRPPAGVNRFREGRQDSGRPCQGQEGMGGCPAAGQARMPCGQPPSGERPQSKEQ